MIPDIVRDTYMKYTCIDKYGKYGKYGKYPFISFMPTCTKVGMCCIYLL